jgi:hypothetical protein
MDFIVGLPRTQLGYNSIWVIVDRLAKVAHFILVKTTYSKSQLAELYMLRIVCLYGVSKNIVSNWGTQFTTKFWERLHETLDTQLRFSSAYHPQMDGQIEGVNQILENLLKSCALQYIRSWDKSLPYVEFSYNNSYQESLKMAPFEILYGRRWWTPLFWSRTGGRKVFGPDILQDAEKQVHIVRENLCVAQSRQKSYVDHRRRDLSHPVFKAKTRCSSYVCPGSSCHTYGQNVSTEYQCLYYIVSYYKNLLQVQKGLSSGMDTILPQAVDRGFCTSRRSLHQRTPHLLSSRV